MKLINHKCEELLLETFRTYWETEPTKRCLYMRTSLLEQPKEEWLPHLKIFLQQELDDDIKEIYLCHDGDIFILSRSLTHRRVNKFLSHLIPSFSPAPPPGLASLFELGIHWGKLRILLEKKIEHREETSAQTPAKNSLPDSESLSRKDLLERIDPNLIRSLSDRRVERMHPEILIVEDDPFSEKLVSNALKTNYSLSSTKDGQGAILSYVNKAPDVMFLDIGLPDITGHQVLEKIFDLDPTAYVVMFSGNGDRDNIMRAIELGAKGFVGKPFSKDKLVQYIEKSPFIQAKTREKSHEHRIH